MAHSLIPPFFEMPHGVLCSVQPHVQDKESLLEDSKHLLAQRIQHSTWQTELAESFQKEHALGCILRFFSH